MTNEQNAPAPDADWVMVPREATHEMKAAGMETSPMYQVLGTGRRVSVSDEDAGAIYAAMLAAAPKPAAPPSVTDADAVVTAMVEAHPAFREWWNELPETTAQSFMDRLAPVLAPRAQPEVKPSSDEIRDHPLSKFAVPPTESHAVQSAPVDWNPGLWGGK